LHLKELFLKEKLKKISFFLVIFYILHLKELFLKEKLRDNFRKKLKIKISSTKNLNEKKSILKLI